jgi:hypothetical protein
MITSVLRPYRPTNWIAGLALLLAAATPAAAQFRPRPVADPSVGERFHIEGSVDLWFPTADLTFASAGTDNLAGIPGTEIDAKGDLGLQDKNLPQFGLVVKGGKNRHKLRVQYIPVKYEQTGPLPRRIVFNGQAYPAGAPMNSTLKWQALRLGYEYDFVLKPRGFGGFIIEDKQTDVRVDLATPLVTPQFAHAQAPIPALGGIARYYPTPHLAITGEVTGFKIPDSIDNRYNAHYVDVDVYGMYNFTHNVGARFGYRSMDLGYLFKEDSGSFTLKGVYVGFVARY